MTWSPIISLKTVFSYNIGDTVTGHLGFYGSGSLDSSDWYRFNLLERGKVTFNAVATGPLHFNNLLIFGMDTISLLVYGTWGTKGSVHTIITEPGTYFFKISRYYEYGSYLLTSTFKPVPSADYSYIQNLHTVSFTNLTTGADQYTWNFGDGLTSNLFNPTHTYTQPEEYFVELIAQNECGPDTMIRQITILGVQGINGNKGRNNGIASFYIFGGGLTANATVKLKRSGFSDISADTVIKPNVFSIKATFDLTGIAIGLWDVEVTVPGFPPYTLANSYTIEAGTEPEFDLYVSGRNKILFNRWQTYTINYSNLGNVDMIGAPFSLLISDIPGLEIQFLSKTIGIPAQPNNIWWQQLQDSTETYFTIDSLNGEPFAARVYSNYSAVEECKRKFPKDKPTDNPIQAVSSFDPNEIIGVKGFKNEHYTGKESPYNYQIYFGNMATASAPAQEVLIFDTLDLTKYNKQQFSFGYVGFGDTILYPIQNGYEFTLDVDLRPTKDLITRISGVFDTTNCYRQPGNDHIRLKSANSD